MNGFNTEPLGRWGEEREFKVERERLVAYAQATNDEHPLHLAGEIAPPVFAIVPVFEAMIPGVAEVVPGEALAFVVHGEQDMIFHRPIEPGMTLLARSMPTGIVSKPSGTRISLRLETREAGATGPGELVNEQWMLAFFRGIDAGVTEGEHAPPHPFDESLRDTPPIGEVTQHVDDDQTFRYSEASGDRMPIHLDENVAKAAGLPGIIAHGLCTMAFTSRAVIQTVCSGTPTNQPGNPRRLRRLAVRFSRPVLPGEDVTTRLWTAGAGRTHFESTSSSGNVVIKDGLAEVE